MYNTSYVRREEDTDGGGAVFSTTAICGDWATAILSSKAIVAATVAL